MNADLNRDRADTAAAMPKHRAAYDAAIIGGGLNGLTTAAYLARAGMRVIVLEARGQVGGTASTAEFAPGFRVDLCRHDIGHVPIRIWKDLDLKRHGLTLISSNPGILAPAPDGTALVLESRRPGEPGESLKRLAPADAARWPEFTRRVAMIAGFLERAYQAPVPNVDASAFGELATALRLGLRLRGLGKADMVEALRVLPMSVAEWLDDWFEHPVLKGVLASRGVAHTCQGPRAAGTAFVLLHHQVGRHAGAFRSSMTPLGGVGALADALANAARTAGAEIRTNARVARVEMRGARATGVVLESGEEIQARRVVSGASPGRTFLELCDPTQLQPEFVRAVRNIRYRGVMAKVHLALDGLPRFRGDTSDAVHPTRSIVIAPDIDYIERAYDDAKYGRVSARPYLDVAIPTILSPALAPEGRHVMSIQVQYAPYRLRDASDGAGKAPGIRAWDAASRDALADHVVRTLAEYAPELPGLVRHRHVLTPRDLEDQLGLPEGHAYHGELALDQALFMRPVPACGRYRTPVSGLYVCGSGAHPGGGVPGQAGANAAKQILGDARRGTAPR